MKFEEVVKKYKQSGGHFFDKDTMEFWGTELVPHIYPFDVFFTWDDNFDRSKKLVSVRRFTDDFSSIDTLSFQEYDNLDDALEFYYDWVKERDEVYYNYMRR